jgi:hypothetical protein
VVAEVLLKRIQIHKPVAVQAAVEDIRTPHKQLVLKADQMVLGMLEEVDFHLLVLHGLEEVEEELERLDKLPLSQVMVVLVESEKQTISALAQMFFMLVEEVVQVMVIIIMALAVMVAVVEVELTIIIKQLQEPQIQEVAVVD